MESADPNIRFRYLAPRQPGRQEETRRYRIQRPQCNGPTQCYHAPRNENGSRREAQEVSEQGEEVAVLDSATLIDAGWTSLVDEVWLVIASKKTIIRRLRKRDALSDDTISARLASQLTNEEQLNHADKIINNDGTIEELTTAVKELWTKRIETKVRNDGAT